MISSTCSLALSRSATILELRGSKLSPDMSLHILLFELSDALFCKCFVSEVEPLTDKLRGLAEGLTDSEVEVEFTRDKGFESIGIEGIGELPIECGIREGASL